jgi:proteasome assembly chaperone (PAC2) family protein
MEQVDVEDVSVRSASIAIVGFPCVGHAEKLVTDHLLCVRFAIKVAWFTFTLFLPQVYLDGDAIFCLPRNEIFFVPETDEQISMTFLQLIIMLVAGSLWMFYLFWKSAVSTHWEVMVSVA